MRRTDAGCGGPRTTCCFVGRVNSRGSESFRHLLPTIAERTRTQELPPKLTPLLERTVHRVSRSDRTRVRPRLRSRSLPCPTLWIHQRGGGEVEIPISGAELCYRKDTGAGTWICEPILYPCLRHFPSLNKQAALFNVDCGSMDFCGRCNSRLPHCDTVSIVTHGFRNVFVALTTDCIVGLRLICAEP